jgi:hypothetical protein
LVRFGRVPRILSNTKGCQSNSNYVD